MSEDRSCQVYIGYLPNDARMEDVEDFFKGMKAYFETGPYRLDLGSGLIMLGVSSR